MNYLILFQLLVYLCLLNAIKIRTIFETNPQLKNRLISRKVSVNDFTEAFEKCSKNGKVEYFDNTKFIFEEPELCKGRVSIFVAVHSNTPHFAHRQLIRETYGSLNRIGNFTIRLGFFVGQSKSEEEQGKINEESSTNNDIIQRDFVESYRNMSRKHLTVMEWVSTNCQNADYLVKTDDDIFIDMFHVIREISSGRVSNGFLCSATKHSKPVRTLKNPKVKKWFVTLDEYNKKFYPPYCEGLGYILPIPSLVSRIYTCGLLRPIFWIDDVYVTGVLAELLHIPVNAFLTGGGYAYLKPSHASPTILDGVFYVPYWSQLNSRQIEKLWRASLQYSMLL